MSVAIRIREDQVKAYAARYFDPRETGVEELVPVIKSRGYLTKGELLIVGRWKSQRIIPLLNENSDEQVVKVTEMMLKEPDPCAIKIPCRDQSNSKLHGVQYAVASTILHWFHPEQFPIYDFRAIWAMGWENKPENSFKFWEIYVDQTRKLAKDWNVDMRTLDRALWEYSKENQNPQQKARCK